MMTEHLKVKVTSNEEKWRKMSMPVQWIHNRFALII
jgi:hypothetical protein